MSAGIHHAASEVIDRSAATVFAYVSDAINIGKWALGMWATTDAGDGLVTGASLFDGSRSYARTDCDGDRLIIDFHLGADRENLTPRITAKIVPGPHVGLNDDQCVFTLLAWRVAGMDDLRWRKLTASHELEVILLKSMLEQQ